jgi:hypothetical protein
MAFQRLSAALKMSMLWLVGGVLLGGLIGAVIWLFFTPARHLPNMNYPFWANVTPLAFAMGISGFVAGGVFALLLAQRARNLSINRMRPLVIAGWGTLAGFIAGAAANFGILTLLGAGTRVEWVLQSAVICAIASLGAATGVLTIAKRAPALPGEQKGFEPLPGESE